MRRADVPKSSKSTRQRALKSTPPKNARGWRHADNEFTLTNGRIQDGFIRFHVKRTRGAPALVFSMGKAYTLSCGGGLYDVRVNTFIPRTLVGSVVSASGEVSFFYHSEVAAILLNW
jgi:hypothetical protein